MHDERAMQKAFLKYDTGAGAKSVSTSQNPSRANEVMYRSQDHTNLLHAPINDGILIRGETEPRERVVYSG